MSFKIAIASSDNQTINEHFGRARHFLIFDLVDSRFTLAEVREIASPHCGGVQHDAAAVENIVELLSDCRLVLASQIGPRVIELLRIKEIKGYAVSGLIDQTLARLASSYEVKNYLKNLE